ncbi:MAG: hypothetical protein K2J39_10735 [Ruminococcus sp.]|nr:hypothetical protein [Ruminococcus sp.]
MGRLKEGLNSGVHELANEGTQVTDTAQQELRDAQESASKLDSLNCIDDDDQSASDGARSESQAIARETAENEVRNPTREIKSGFDSIKAESDTYATIEEQDAETASGMEGRYNSVGSSLASSFRNSMQEFIQISSEAQDTGNQLESVNGALASGIESSFG